MIRFIALLIIFVTLIITCGRIINIQVNVYNNRNNAEEQIARPIGEPIAEPRCPECGRRLIIRQNRVSRRRFWGCVGFAKQGCRFTRNI